MSPPLEPDDPLYGLDFNGALQINRLLVHSKYKRVYLADCNAEALGIPEAGVPCLPRRVALKLIRAPHVAKAELDKIKSVPDHPHIARTFFGSSIPPWHYVVEEFLDGILLSKVAPMTILEVVRFGSQIADALSTMHAAGFVYNDLKPDNIMLCANGPKITDFGASFLTDKTQPCTHCTTKYRAPEAFDQTPLPASDVWSLGVILYEQLTSHRPFEQDQPNLPPDEYHAHMKHKIQNDEPIQIQERNPQVPDELSHLIHTALNKNPTKRPTASHIERTLGSRSANSPTA